MNIDTNRMPTKKKPAAPVESTVIRADAPKKTPTSARSSRKKADAASAGPVASRSDATPVAESGTKRNAAVVMLWIAGSVFLLTAVGTAIYYYRAYRQATDAKPTASEAEQLVARLSRFMELPSDEAPTLATVTDKTKLSGQDFFVSAENGDKVLIYQTAGKAILFRPSTGKIVNFAPVSTKGSGGDQEQVTEGSTQPAEVPVMTQASSGDDAAQSAVPAGKVAVELYNGSAKVGVTADVERRILARYADTMEVVGKGMASNKEYEGIQVIDLTGTRAQQASDLAALLGGAVVGSGVPDGERVSDGTDILVIVGNPS